MSLFSESLNTHSGDSAIFYPPYILSFHQLNSKDHNIHFLLQIGIKHIKKDDLMRKMKGKNSVNFWNKNFVKQKMKY